MKKLILSFFLLPVFAFADVLAGVGKTELTPPSGTPSAGYTERNGVAMQGVHDPLLAIALYIDNGKKSIALCSVDHLGFTYSMAQEIIGRVRARQGLQDCEIYIGSSHTHSGGGAFLDIPVFGDMLAGRYDPEVTELYIDKTAQAIIEAWKNRALAQIGIGYGNAYGLSRYRGQWPRDIGALSNVALIKVVNSDGSPLAALFNFPVHPTVLDGKNLLFSSDFIGYARDRLVSLLGSGIQPIYFNGAQGDIIPTLSDENNRYNSCETLGAKLASAVADIWESTATSADLEIDARNLSYEFTPQATTNKLSLPVPSYKSEMNLLVLNKTHAFVSIPGELSCAYDESLKRHGQFLGYNQVSILGLTNDAHGYIILPESWRHQTFESKLSFGGEFYGDITEQRAKMMLEGLSPKKDDSE